DKVVLNGKADVTIIGELLARVVDSYADNITGELARSPFVSVVVPTGFRDAVNPSRAIRVANQDVDANVTIDAQPVTAPVRLLGIASLITGQQISAIAQFVPTGGPSPQPGTAISATQTAVEKAFQ